jgi:hypothetical protein
MKSEDEIRRLRDALLVNIKIPCDCKSRDEHAACKAGGLMMQAAACELSWALTDERSNHDEVVEKLIANAEDFRNHPRTSRRLPAPEFGGTALRGRNIKGWTIGSWCPTPDGSGPPQCVAMTIETETGEHLVMRIKTPAAVDETIQALLRHKRDVWPDAP